MNGIFVEVQLPREFTDRQNVEPSFGLRRVVKTRAWSLAVITVGSLKQLALFSVSLGVLYNFLSKWRLYYG